jgi:hypothetical protein
VALWTQRWRNTFGGLDTAPAKARQIVSTMRAEEARIVLQP